ncbi:MAG: membrane protein insertase YidC [Campylobacteraceae bacterium]|nr:membrane protein insertase YidC [Campylobacteraceae bacterium]MBT7116891.1 membrane protein insertase YidC [Campylobacteraceae bacterium]
MNKNNNLSKQDSQKRIFIAMILSFVFFIAYDFLYIQPQQAVYDQQQAVASKTTTTGVDNKNQAPQVANSTNTNAAPVTKITQVNEIVSRITTNKNIIEIDSFGRIAQVTLLEEQYIDEDGKQIKLFASNQLRPLEVRFSNRALNEEAFKTNVVASSSSLNTKNGVQTLTLTQKMSNNTLVKTMKFYPDGHYDINVNVTNGAEFFVTPGFRPDVMADMYADHGVVLKMNDGTLTIVEDEDLDKTVNFTGVKFASAFDRYYSTILYNFKTSLAISLMPDNDDSPQVFIHAKDNIDLSGYAGPKNYRDLASLNKELTDAIEYGWFTFIAKPMFLLLQYIHDYVGNWGWTIVLVTILIKLILYPLSYKGMVSMNKLKELSPKIKEIQEKYKNDKQKSGAKMMEFYKKEGVNPMGGCLPILLQIPVFFSIYRVLLNSIELKGAEWAFWITDLAEMDPYFVLPILMGITMYVQQLITPNQMQDELQKKLFQFLPVIFTFFFLWFPAGLTLYWFINNLFTIAQQYYVNTLFAKAKVARHEDHLSHKHNKKD